jgi:hypothetical protein
MQLLDEIQSFFTATITGVTITALKEVKKEIIFG